MPDDIYQPWPLFVNDKLAGAADSSVIGVDGGKTVNTDGIPKGKPKLRQSPKGWPTIQYQTAWNPPSIENVAMNHEGKEVKDFTRPKDQLLFKMLKGMSDSRISMLKQSDTPASEHELKRAMDNLSGGNLRNKGEPQ